MTPYQIEYLTPHEWLIASRLISEEVMDIQDMEYHHISKIFLQVDWKLPIKARSKQIQRLIKQTYGKSNSNNL